MLPVSPTNQNHLNISHYVCLHHSAPASCQFLASVEAPVTSSGGNSVLPSVSYEPFNLSNTADGEAAGSHKERPQRPMTASSAQAQHPPPPTRIQAFFFFKGKKGVRGNTQNSSQCVGEAGSTHQSKVISAGGSWWGEPPQTPPPTNGRLFSKPRHETGEYLLDGPDLLSIKAEAVSPLDVSVVLQNDAQWFWKVKTPMLFKTQMELKRPGGFEGALK